MNKFLKDKPVAVTHPLFGEVFDFKKNLSWRSTCRCAYCGKEGAWYAYSALLNNQRWVATWNCLDSQQHVYFCSWHCAKNKFFQIYQMCRLRGIGFDIEDIPF